MVTWLSEIVPHTQPSVFLLIGQNATISSVSKGPAHLSPFSLVARFDPVSHPLMSANVGKDIPVNSAHSLANDSAKSVGVLVVDSRTAG